MNQRFMREKPILPLLLSMALPMVVSMLVNSLYNIIDSLFVAKIGEDAITALSLVYPVQNLINALAIGFGVGINAVISYHLGAGEIDKADAAATRGIACSVVHGVVSMIVCITVMPRFLRLFTDSEQVAEMGTQYASIAFAFSVIIMVGLAFEKIYQAMGRMQVTMTALLFGCVTNIVLDPLLIFGIGPFPRLGMRGAALATILSQLLSAIWILRFLTSDKTILKLRRSSMRLSARRVRKIVGLGLSGFTMAITNCTVQIMCNATLQVYGGDLYVGVMTVINSIREIATLPVTGVTHSAQPVLGFNYGAKEYGRVKKAIVFTSFIAILYTTGIWLIVDGFPAFFIRIFNQDAELIAAGIPAIRLYFFGFFMMSLQFSGQSIFVGLGESKKAIFFSIFRKVIIVVPLTILLPGMFGMGTNGVFAAEPISNFIGGIACFGTMLFTIWRKLTKLQKQEAV